MDWEARQGQLSAGGCQWSRPVSDEDWGWGESQATRGPCEALCGIRRALLVSALLAPLLGWVSTGADGCTSCPGTSKAADALPASPEMVDQVGDLGREQHC